jgi:tetratricopeptide (TPR) repeat protein
VQQEIAAQISDKLRARLTNEQKARIAKRQTENPEAYQLYLKGRYYAAKFDADDLNKGLDYFRRAIALDPNYALAYDGLSYYYQLIEDLFVPVGDAMPKSKEAARKALEIDDRIADSHVEMGAVYTFYDFDWAAAEREFKRAIELEPNYAPAHEYYSWLLVSLARTGDALAESRRAEQLDPLSAEIASFTGWWLYLARRYDDAIVQLNKCLELDPNYWVCHWIMGEAYEGKGRFSEAIAEEAKVLQIDSRINWAIAESARADVLSGKRGDARQKLDELLALSKRSHVSKYCFVTIYAALGEKSQALDALDEAYAERSEFLDFLKTDPKLDNLRSEPRFQDLVRRMNFPQ